MNLKEITNKLFEDSKRTPIRGLNAIAEAEKYLQQAYEGRYFFELIQNVRDANKEKNQDGEIFIELKGNVLSITNTGAEFNAKGIEGITTIGQSTKHSQDYIGFKGIGFKSIQEITETPKIVTKYGSIYFDRKLTLNKYNTPDLKEDQIPLFYFPHFNTKKLSKKDIKKGFVTKVELPIKENITHKRIIDNFSEIQSKQLILLGNIQTLKFESEKYISTFSIKKKPQKHSIEVTENDNTSKFKYYTPANKVEIPIEVIRSLDGKEKEIFSNNAFVDVNIVLELAENGQINPIKDAKLYLFYPLQITSGFRFIIHSYFIVNPERTNLRESRLNDFLLSAIGKFIGIEMLANLKKTKINTNKVLSFIRNNDAKLNVLYNSVVAELKNQRFIYDSQTQKYFYPSEVIVADDFDKGLFQDGRLGSKKLIYIDDAEVIKWLRDEFKIYYLHYEDITSHIENECKRQLKHKNIKFFQNLYNYVSKHEQLNLTGKKVLLTDNWKLVSSEEDVFYGGGRRNPINLPSSIKKKIHFINKDIKISDFREGKSRTGITEFNTYELVRRLLKLFDERSVQKMDLLNALYNIQQLDVKSELEIREKIRLPIKETDKWLSPLTNPIYLENENLRKLYPNGDFVDDTILSWAGDKKDEIPKAEFLKKFGAWDIPAIYISEKQVTINSIEKRDKVLGRFSGFSARPFYIKNDRILHLPDKYNVWFTHKLMDNWNTYQFFLNDNLLPRMQYSNTYSNWRDASKEATIKLSHFIECLSNEKWICYEEEDEKYSVSEVVGVRHFDFVQTHNYIIRKFLKLLPIDLGIKRDFIEAIGLVHLDTHSIENFEQLLQHIFKKYETGIPEGKEFIDFYNRILGKLVDFYEVSNMVEIITQQLRKIHFLSMDEATKIPCWKTAAHIFYIDDKPAYDILPPEIKQKIQPHFTNRDKNTFGKIAGRIGKRFSKSIKKEHIETESVNTDTFISFFELLPETIALLESHLGDAITKHFTEIKSIKVFEKKELKVKISVEDSPEIIIPVNHFVDADLNIHLAIPDSITNKNKQFAQCINELFIHLLERDLRNFNANLLNFLNAPNKKDYLNSYDIAEERVNEIRDKLNDTDFSPNQKFWSAILTAKGISSKRGIFIADKVDINNLSELLKTESEIIQEVEDQFDFLQTNSYANIPILVKFLSSLSMTLEELNKIIFPRIDFRNFYLKELPKLKNKFEKGFNAILYNHLTTKNNEEKCLYQNYLDNYKYHLEFIIPLNTLELNTEEFFLKSLTEAFPLLKITHDDLQKDFSSFNPNPIYSANLNLLKNKLAVAKLAKDNLDSFLAENKKRSLLYFGEVDSLSTSFSKWLEQRQKDNTPVSKEDNISVFLSQFSNQTNTGIEQAHTLNIEIRTGTNGTTSGGSGRRYDGGMNDDQKQRIGLVAEMIVFEKLSVIYSNVAWISKNASKVHKTHVGYNPEGQDGLGYDIEYIDKDGNKYFIEVKGRADSYDSFEISKNEIDKAYKEGEFYKIILVTQTMNNTQRRIRDLGTIFMLDDGEDFFTNSKFTAIYKNFEIRFRE